MTDRVLITDEELHAFIDGELDPIRAADIAVLLQYEPALRERIAAFRADKALLGEVYGPLIDRPLPLAWEAKIRQARARRAPPIGRRAALAAAASVAAAVVGIGLVRRYGGSAEDALLAAAMAAHNDDSIAPAGAPVETAAADDALQSALAVRVQVPDMSKLGFHLTGYRLQQERGNARAVSLSYRDGAGRPFTLYLTASGGTERFDMLKRDRLRICVWDDEVVAAVMLADVPAGEMLRLATLAYAGLTPSA